MYRLYVFILMQLQYVISIWHAVCLDSKVIKVV